MPQDEMTCQELVELVTEYLEKQLPPDKLAAFEEHLKGCNGCNRYIEQMRITIHSVGTLKESDITPVAQQKLLHVFQDWKTHRAP